MSYILSDTTLGPVWFSSMKTDGLLYTEPGGPLVFPDNISSLGLGFDPVTSVFTAPVPGLYFFTATLRHNDVYDFTALNLFWVGADGNRAYLRRAVLDGTTNSKTATSNAILNLERGDTIHITIDPGQTLACLYCNFDGYLLHRHL